MAKRHLRVEPVMLRSEVMFSLMIQKFVAMETYKHVRMYYMDLQLPEAYWEQNE